MKRFLLVLALVAVAGATYVATAPGSQTAAGPTARQFNALKRQVAALKKQVGALKTQVGEVKDLAVQEGTLVFDCMAHSLPIDQFGDLANPATYGYSYTDPTVNGGSPFLTTGLDVTTPDDPGALWVTGGDSACNTDINGPALRKLARLTGIRPHSASRVFHAGTH